MVLASPDVVAVEETVVAAAPLPTIEILRTIVAFELVEVALLAEDVPEDQLFPWLFQSIQVWLGIGELCPASVTLRDGAFNLAVPNQESRDALTADPFMALVTLFVFSNGILPDIVEAHDNDADLVRAVHQEAYVLAVRDREAHEASREEEKNNTECESPPRASTEIVRVTSERNTQHGNTHRRTLTDPTNNHSNNRSDVSGECQLNRHELAEIRANLCQGTNGTNGPRNHVNRVHDEDDQEETTERNVNNSNSDEDDIASRLAKDAK